MKPFVALIIRLTFSLDASSNGNAAEMGFSANRLKPRSGIGKIEMVKEFARGTRIKP